MVLSCPQKTRRTPHLYSRCFGAVSLFVRSVGTLCSSENSDRVVKDIAYQNIANSIASLNDHVLRGDRALEPVEEEFGVVAEGMPEWRGETAISWHRLILTISYSRLGEIFQLIRFGPSRDEEVANPAAFFERIAPGQLLLYRKRPAQHVGRNRWPWRGDRDQAGFQGGAVAREALPRWPQAASLAGAVSTSR